MAANISIIVDGVETPLSTIGRLKGHEGWGMAPIRRLSEAGPLQDGSTDRGYRLDPRIGKFVFKLDETELEDMYVQRAAIQNYFLPISTLQVKFVVGLITKVIDCKTMDLDLPWDVEKWAAQNFVVSLRCNDPTFYDPVGKSKVFVIGGGGNMMEVPTVIPMTVGASTIDVYETITILGNYKTYPHIRITGPITDPVITHMRLIKKLDFTGITIAAGNYYDIDLRYGYKTIVDSTGVNKLSELTADSDLTTFYLAAHPELSHGINPIHVTGTACTLATGVEFTWFDHFTGI
ncbi:MAG: hypothetical protein A2Y53_04915 [Chloroflexi bacterium RBG_16_47_49]|nr:MAG: hypothetical protein A2Y53_04915 [Chloroflexi bacterium RBG_16_47_49]